MDPIELLALFGPAIKDGTMALIKKWTGDSAGKPANVTEYIQLMEAETKQLEARCKIGDTEGETYKWVVAVIKLQRPIIVYGTIFSTLLMNIFNLGTTDQQASVMQMARIVIYWLFGERYQMKSKDK